MTEFSRLLVSSESPTTRALLRSGLADAPRAESFGRVAAALGVSAGVVAAAAPASAFVNGAVGGSTLAAGSKASGTSALLLGKWLLSGLVGGAIVSGTAGVVTNSRARAAAEANRPVASSAAAAQPRPGSSRRASVQSMPSLLEPASSASGSGSMLGLPSPPSGSAFPASGPSGALGAEAQRIDAVRRALGRGDIQRALIELDWYDRSRVVGVLDREAELLRIEALVRAGERERAVELGRAYLTRHPHDAYAARLTELVASRGTHFPVGSGIDR